MSSGNDAPKIGLITAICLIAANMIGTGVFTSLGFQTMGIQSTSALLFLWVAGGIVALCGALTYAELAVSMPKSGGEYHYLSKIYHPSLGFLSGWVSSTVGFAGPVAISSLAFGEYFSTIIPVNEYLPDMGISTANILATLLLLLITLINIISLKAGSGFQTFFTLLNLTLIVSIIICGFRFSDHSHFVFTLNKSDADQIFSSSFATSLVYVSFAYSGWNSATYIAEEIKNPEKNLPKALFLGSFIVMILYLLLNFIFLYSTPIPELSGQIQVAFIAAKNILGENGARIIAMIISVGLIASVNSMMFTGPRVTQAIGRDFPFFNTFAYRTTSGSPVFAILFQAAIALILIQTSSFQQLMTYLGFTLSLFTTLTVAGVYITRYRMGKAHLPYRTIGYPVIPALFILIELWMMFFILKQDPIPSIAGLLTIIIGMILFIFINKNRN